jgi:hypothetical protein
VSLKKPQPPAAERPSQYLPAGPPEPQIFEDFEGVYTTTSRPGVDDKQMWWCDGFMPIGKRFLRTMYGVGPALFSASSISSSAVVFFDFANIGSTPYCVVINAVGQVFMVNTNTGAVIIAGGVGTITNPSRSTVGVSQYGSLYIIIVAQQTNGYFLWDGTTFFKPGDTQPDGSGTMPTGIGGTGVETYQGRIWIIDDATVIFGAPGSAWDFSTGNGGGNFTSTDSFLRVRFTQLKQTNGFLYLIGDSSVNYISGVQTSGSPPTTTFTNQNADPEVGTPWGATPLVFSRNILFANPFGVQVSYGAAVTKISTELDGVYNTVANFGAFLPSAAKAIIFGKKCFILLLPIVDPVSGQQVNKLLIWDGKKWWASEQDVTLNYIQYQEINSVLTTYGTDGDIIYPLFQEPSIGFTKTVQSKLWDKPGSYHIVKASARLWAMFRYYSALSPSLDITIDNETSSNSVASSLGPLTAQWTTASGVAAAWHTTALAAAEWTTSGEGIVVLEPTAIAQNGRLSGLTVQTTAADMAIISMMIQNEVEGYAG